MGMAATESRRNRQITPAELARGMEQQLEGVPGFRQLTATGSNIKCGQTRGVVVSSLPAEFPVRLEKSIQDRAPSRWLWA
jgi:hypothetical protein